MQITKKRNAVGVQPWHIDRLCEVLGLKALYELDRPPSVLRSFLRQCADRLLAAGSDALRISSICIRPIENAPGLEKSREKMLTDPIACRQMGHEVFIVPVGIRARFAPACWGHAAYHDL